MIATAVRLAIAVVLVAAVAAGALYLYSPPKSLDVLNDLFPGDSGAERLATGVPFGPRRDLGLDVWGKASKTGVRKPVLVFFYGGGWAMGRRQDYGFVAKAYAARGFIVVIPDYRKVPAVHFPTYIEDGAAAVRWVHDNIARFGGDPDHIALGGHSAGGYIAVMLGLDHRYLTAVGVDPRILRAIIGLAGP
jgi:acetyl esterase/lipase